MASGAGRRGSGLAIGERPVSSGSAAGAASTTASAVLGGGHASALTRAGRVPLVRAQRRIRSWHGTGCGAASPEGSSYAGSSCLLACRRSRKDEPRCYARTRTFLPWGEGSSGGYDLAWSAAVLLWRYRVEARSGSDVLPSKWQHRCAHPPGQL